MQYYTEYIKETMLDMGHIMKSYIDENPLMWASGHSQGWHISSFDFHHDVHGYDDSFLP